MALDAVVFPQDPFGYNCSFKDHFQGMEADELSRGSNCLVFNNIGTNLWSYDQLGFHEDQDGKSLLTVLETSPAKDNWEPNTNSPPEDQFHGAGVCEMPGEEEEKKDQPVATRRKRRRTKACKNKEEVESQRMTHIAVERNRRKQMNEYLAVLRTLMPSSYAQRGDQASIIGGAINFVKELEQLLQTLEAQKSTKNHHQQDDHRSPFASFFTFPQYTATRATAAAAVDDDKVAAEGRHGAADIEVTMVESHANVKILAKRCSRQLVRLVGAFLSLRLSVQHLNVSSLGHMVMYSVSVKVEEGCELNSVDEIAAAVNQMLRNIEEESSG